MYQVTSHFWWLILCVSLTGLSHVQIAAEILFLSVPVDCVSKTDEHLNQET